MARISHSQDEANPAAGQVAQLSNLPCRGFPTRNRPGLFGDPADWKSAIQQVGGLLGLAGMVWACAGCRTPVHIPPANLKAPGWTVRHGQAVWHIPKGEREIAGEVLVGMRPDGQAFVQFSKSPFTLVVAQSTPTSWAVEFPPQNKHYSGHGVPPKRIIWLYLPRVLAGKTPPKNWTWKQDSSGWRLEDHSNGEFLEGYFDQ